VGPIIRCNAVAHPPSAVPEAKGRAAGATAGLSSSAVLRAKSPSHAICAIALIAICHARYPSSPLTAGQASSATQPKTRAGAHAHFGRVERSERWRWLGSAGHALHCRSGRATRRASSLLRASFPVPPWRPASCAPRTRNPRRAYSSPPNTRPLPDGYGTRGPFHRELRRSFGSTQDRR